MSQTLPREHITAQVSLIDEVIGVLARGEDALFADLAQAMWQPHATLAALIGSDAAVEMAEACTRRRG